MNDGLIQNRLNRGNCFLSFLQKSEKPINKLFKYQILILGEICKQTIGFLGLPFNFTGLLLDFTGILLGFIGLTIFFS